MSLAKEKLFGKKPPKWPLLHRFVEEGILLPIDLAYAATQTQEEKRATTYAALLMMARQGHLCLTRERVAEISPALAKLVDEEAQLPKYAKLEEEISTHVKRLLAHPHKIPQTPSEELTEEQMQAVTYATNYPFSLITGGPGTGKTYTASHIAKLTFGKVLLAAPTGKAAAHLEAKVGDGNSYTLHTLLRENRVDADLLLVDEASMIDPSMFARLLSAISAKTTLVLMGDVDQLPAVEGGSIFQDLIDLSKIPTTHLTKCHRSDRKEILDLAASIRRGESIEMVNLDLGEDHTTIYENLWRHSQSLFQEDFQILSTLRKGPLGVDALNAYFYEKFSTKTNKHPIIITRNHPSTGLSNGDTGLLIEGEGAQIKDQFIPLYLLPSFEYAYCISVHKAQGSEYGHVLLLVPEGTEVFGREVLYTAVTRAKMRLEIAGDSTQIASALSRSSRKQSFLRQKFIKTSSVPSTPST